MSSIIKRLKKVAEGDLTIQMKTKGNSEFAMLNRHIANVIDNTRKLILEVEGIVGMVNISAEDVGGLSVKMEQSSNGILEALEEIDIGVNQQAGDAQQCLQQMDSLSTTIKSITEDIEVTAASSSNVFSVAQSQKEVVNTLTEASDELKENMEELKEAISVFKTMED